MCAKDAYRQKREAEPELVQAKSAEFEAPAKSLTADIRIKYTRQADNLKRKIDIKKAQLKRRGETNKDFWDLLRYCF